MGRYNDIIKLLSGLEEKCIDCRRKMLYHVLGYYTKDNQYYEKAKKAELGPCYPVRLDEMKILEDVIAKTDDNDAKMLLGCLLYNKLHYEKAAKLWEDCKDNYIAKSVLFVYNGCRR